jgi:hypothetical protein
MAGHRNLIHRHNHCGAERQNRSTVHLPADREAALHRQPLSSAQLIVLNHETCYEAIIVWGSSNFSWRLNSRQDVFDGALEKLANVRDRSFIEGDLIMTTQNPFIIEIQDGVLGEKDDSTKLRQLLAEYINKQGVPPEFVSAKDDYHHSTLSNCHDRDNECTCDWDDSK